MSVLEVPGASSPQILVQHRTRYLGFVHVPLQLDGRPGPEHVLSCSELFLKKNLKTTQAMHPLFARGIKKDLMFTINNNGVKACLYQGFQKGKPEIVLSIPSRRISTVGCIDDALFIISRRSGSKFYNCHKFTVRSGSVTAENAAIALSKLAKTDFRRDSLTPKIQRKSTKQGSKFTLRPKKNNDVRSSSPLAMSVNSRILSESSMSSPPLSPLRIETPTSRLSTPSPLQVEIETAQPEFDASVLRQESFELAEEYGFDEEDIALSWSLIESAAGSRPNSIVEESYPNFPLQASSALKTAAKMMMVATQQFISETDLTALDLESDVGYGFGDDDDVFIDTNLRQKSTASQDGGGPVCGICFKSNIIAGEKWSCMKFCDCSFHASCLEEYRFEGHNLCPVCSGPISHSLFHALYIGKALASEDVDVTDASLSHILEANQSLSNDNKLAVRLKINKTHVRFETITDDDEVAIFFKRAIKDVVRIDRINNVRISITFTPENLRSDKPERVVIVFGEPEPEPDIGTIVQVFQLHTAAEAKCLYESAILAFEQSKNFTGSTLDLSKINGALPTKANKRLKGMALAREMSQSLNDLSNLEKTSLLSRSIDNLSADDKKYCLNDLPEPDSPITGDLTKSFDNLALLSIAIDRAKGNSDEAEN